MKRIPKPSGKTARYPKGLAELTVLAASIVSSAWNPRVIAQSPSACTLDRAIGTTVDAEPFMRNAWGSRWNLATNRVAYMQPNAKGYY